MNDIYNLVKSNISVFIKAFDLKYQCFLDTNGHLSDVILQNNIPTISSICKTEKNNKYIVICKVEYININTNDFVNSIVDPYFLLS